MHARACVRERESNMHINNINLNLQGCHQASGAEVQNHESECVSVRVCVRARVCVQTAAYSKCCLHSSPIKINGGCVESQPELCRTKASVFNIALTFLEQTHMRVRVCVFDL